MQVNQSTAALKGDDATIEAAQLNLSYCYITAPFDGRLGLRQVDPGNLVHATDIGRHHDDNPGASDRRGVHPAAAQPADRSSRQWRRAR